MATRQIVLDTETTGLNAKLGDRVIEIGCVEVVNRRITERHFHAYVNPERDIEEGAAKVHGLTREFLADKPRFAEIAEDLLGFVAGAELVIHNASFDLGFLDAELARLGRSALAGAADGVRDTLLMAREMFPGKANSLDALCRRLEVDNTHRTLHGALLDAGLLAEVYIRLTRGQDSLVIHQDDTSAGTRQALLADDLSGFSLQVLAPSEEELSAHEAVLADLDKASGGKTVWRAAGA